MGDIDVAGMQPFLAGALRVFAIGLLQGVAQLFPGLSPQGVRRSLGCLLYTSELPTIYSV